MTHPLPALHLGFLGKVQAAVAADPRLVALLAAGSYIHGGFDEFSDLDFVVVVDEARVAEVMASRRAFAEGLGDLLSAFTGEHVGEPRLLICLYGPELLHVDLKFVTLADLDWRVESPALLFARDPAQVQARLDAGTVAWPSVSPEWLEQRAWIWLHYGATKLRRGELFEAIAMVGYFREQVLGPMLHRSAGRPQRGLRKIESVAGARTAPLLATLPTHGEASVRAAMRAAVALYLDLRQEAPPRDPVSLMPQALLDYLDPAG